MIEHVFSVLCSGVSIDGDTNSISLFKVLEQLTVYSKAEEPLQVPLHFEIFSLWTRQFPDTPGRGKMRTIFYAPNGQQNQQAELEIDLSQAIYFRSKVISEGIELSGPGKYQFVIEYQEEDDTAWRKVAGLPILVGYQSATPDGNE